MTIGIDVRILAGGRRSGIIEYAERLLEAMIPLAPDHKFKLFFSSSHSQLPYYEWLKAPNVEVHRRRISNNILFMGNRFLDRPHIDKLLGGVDVFFSPHFFISSLSPDC